MNPATPPESPTAERHLMLVSSITLGIAIFAAGFARVLPSRVGPAGETHIFFHQYIVMEWHGALLLGAMTLIGVLLLPRIDAEIVDGLLRWIVRRRKIVALACFVLLALGSLKVYQNHPLAMDEYMAVFQARVFGEGEIYGQFPPKLVPGLIPHHFLNRMFVNAGLTSGRVVSSYLPGFSLVMAPFARLGLEGLLNPLLSALSLLLIASIARRLSPDPLVPGWAVLFTLASPAFTVHGISFYPSTAHLFANLLFMWLLLPRSSRMAPFGAGVVGSLALTLQNPVPHALFAAPWGVHMLIKRQWRALASVGLGYLPLSLILGLGWLRVRQGLGAENAALHLEATGATDPGSELAAFLGVLQIPDGELLIIRLLGFSKLVLWAAPGLPVLALLGLPALRKSRDGRLLVAATALTLLFFFFVVFSQGHGWGYRYFHSVWAFLPLGGAVYMSRASRRLVSLVGFLTVASLLFGTGLRFQQVHQFISTHRAQIATLDEDIPQIRFVDIRQGYYTADLVQNDPFLRGPVLTFVSRGPKADRELALYLAPGARLIEDRGSSSVWALP